MQLIKKDVIFDCDDVLANIRDNVFKALNEATGLSLDYRDSDSFASTHAEYGLDYMAVLEILRDKRVLENSTIEDSAVEVCHQLKQDGFTIRLLTARGWHPEGELITEAFFRDHGIEFDEMIFTQIGQNKADFLRGTSLAFVDDNAPHIHEMISGSKVFVPILMARSWNLFDRLSLSSDGAEVVVDLYEALRLIRKEAEDIKKDPLSSFI